MAPNLFKSFRSKFKDSREPSPSEATPAPAAEPAKPSLSASTSESTSAPIPAPAPTATPKSLSTSQTTASQSPSEPVPTPQSTVSSEILQERLWNDAYDGLKAEEADVVETYEKVLSRQLHPADTASKEPASQKNEIRQTGEERSRQMQELVRLGLEKTAKNAGIKQGIEDGLAIATTVKGMVDKAIQAAPEAAVAWVGVCLALDILSNPITEAGINRRGLSYVVMRMDWYWNLAGLLLDKNRAAASSEGLRDELEKHIVGLYKKLLLYQMKSICIYHRNQALVFLRDMFKLDDWDGQLTDIKDAEVAVRKDSKQFNTEQIKSHLQVIADAAASQESKLDDIHTALLAQTTQQTKFQEQQAKFQEQQAKIRKDDNYNKCLHDLRETDPRDNKLRIQETKGGLLKDSYSWILDHADFKRWRNEPDSRLLWIKGDPGKGKTMLLCGIIDELDKEKTQAMSYFFCQATEPTLRNAAAVLRGIVYVLIDQLPSLVSYIPKKYSHVGKQLFEDEAAWSVLSKMLTTMLDDPILEGAILVIDALDECVTGLPQLLDFICETSSSASAKWVLSSRNWLNIEEKLDAVERIQLSLESNEASVSSAVRTFIGSKVEQLSREKKYDEKTRTAVLDYLVANCDDTFLWAALVCRELGDPKVRRWHTLTKLHTFPSGLDALYTRMMEYINESLDAEICNEILATVSTTYRPVTLKELTSLAESLQDFEEDIETLRELVWCCGSFLNIRNDSLYFIHQSAKDFIVNQASSQILPSGISHQHHVIFLRSLETLSRTLRRNMYDIEDLGTGIDDVSTPDPNPLEASTYSCLYWIDHLLESDSPDNQQIPEALEQDGPVHVYLQEKYLYWLEALSLLRSLSKGVKAVKSLKAMVSSPRPSGEVVDKGVLDLVHDAYRFILTNKHIVEIAPLQLYVSALMFVPSSSLLKDRFDMESPEWIVTKPKMEESWNSCLETIDAHGGSVSSIAFCAHSQKLASCASDSKVKIWDTNTGTCLQVLRGHTGTVTRVAFSPIKDAQRLASSSYDHTVKIWDTDKGVCVQRLEGHESFVESIAFSSDGRQLASGGHDGLIKVWNASTGACLRTLKGHQGIVHSVSFYAAQKKEQLISGSSDRTATTVKIWDPATGACLKTIEGFEGPVTFVAACLLNKGLQLVTKCGANTINVWDAVTGTCLHTLDFENEQTSIPAVAYFENANCGFIASASLNQKVRIWSSPTWSCTKSIQGNTNSIQSLVFLNNSSQLASGGFDGKIKMWDTTAGSDSQPVVGHEKEVTSIVCSIDETRFASSSRDGTVKVWDVATGEYVDSLEGHSRMVISLAFSNDSQSIASGSSDGIVKIWEASTGTCLQTLKGPNGPVKRVVFSNDGRLLASGAGDDTTRIWDTATGAGLHTLEGHSASIKCVAFSENDGKLASGSDDSTIKIWGPETGSCFQTLEGHFFSVVSIAFSKDGSILASSAGDETIKLWDLTNGTCLQTIETPRLAAQLAFDTEDNSQLRTDLGTLQLEMPSSDSSPTEEVVEDPRFLGYGLCDGRQWITKDEKKLVWLPSPYQPGCYSIKGSTIAIGCKSGQVYAMQLSADGPL